MTAFGGRVPRVGRDDHLVAAADARADQAADQRRRAGVDAQRVARAHVRGELALEGGDLVRPLADAVVAEEVLAPDHALERRELLVADLHPAREHRPLGPRPRRRAAVACERELLRLDRHREPFSHRAGSWDSGADARAAGTRIRPSATEHRQRPAERTRARDAVRDPRRAAVRPVLPAGCFDALLRERLSQPGHRADQPPAQRRGLRARRGADPAGRGGAPRGDHRRVHRARCAGSGTRRTSSAAATPRPTASCAPSSPCATTCPSTCATASSPSRAPIRAWVRFAGPGPLRHAGHRRHRLHEHEHQAHGRAGPEAAGRRAAHPGHVRRLARRRSSRPTRAPTRSSSTGATGTRRSSTSSTSASRTSSTRSCSSCGRRRRRSPLEGEYFSCVPYLLGEGQAMQYSFQPRLNGAHARAAPAAAPAGQLPARRDGGDAGRSRTSSSTSCCRCRPTRS